MRVKILGFWQTVSKTKIFGRQIVGKPSVGGRKVGWKRPWPSVKSQHRRGNHILPRSIHSFLYLSLIHSNIDTIAVTIGFDVHLSKKLLSTSNKDVLASSGKREASRKSSAFFRIVRNNRVSRHPFLPLKTLPFPDYYRRVVNFNERQLSPRACNAWRGRERERERPCFRI